MILWKYFLFLPESKHQVKTKVIKVDFSGGHEIYEPIAKELEGFEIGVLGQHSLSHDSQKWQPDNSMHGLIIITYIFCLRQDYIISKW